MIEKLLIFMIFHQYLVNGSLEFLDKNTTKWVENGATNEIILDCDFISNNETNIVVKWFFNGDKDQIYQWIPGSNRTGFPMGSLKKFIDGSYKINNDENLMYSSLKLINISYQLTGPYTCKVSGDTHEIVQTKNLTIFVPPSEGLNLTISYENLTALCTVHGVFPEPKINFYLQNENNTNEEETKVEVFKENNFYTKTTKINFNNETIKYPTKFICEMKIPGTEYELKQIKLLSLGNSSNHLLPNILHSLIVLLSIIVLIY